MSKRKNTRPYLLTAEWEHHPKLGQDRLTYLVEDDGIEYTHHVVDAPDVRIHPLGAIVSWLDEQGFVRTFDAKLPAHVASRSTAKIHGRDMALAFIDRFG